MQVWLPAPLRGCGWAAAPRRPRTAGWCRRGWPPTACPRLRCLTPQSVDEAAVSTRPVPDSTAGAAVVRKIQSCNALSVLYQASAQQARGHFLHLSPAKVKCPAILKSTHRASGGSGAKCERQRHAQRLAEVALEGGQGQQLRRRVPRVQQVVQQDGDALGGQCPLRNRRCQAYRGPGNVSRHNAGLAWRCWKRVHAVHVG